jgi:5-methylcytosine-specific restriction protein A
MPSKPPAHNSTRASEEHHVERATSRERGYSTAWDKESRAHRRANPLCVECKKEGKTVAGDVTDHIKPARWFPELFMDPNWQTLCYKHNNQKRLADDKRYAHLPPRGGSKS